MGYSKTQIALLEAAEIEFANHGFEGASVRSITTRARANVSAVNYHFGNKQQLFKEMLRYRLTPVNEQRLLMLQEAVESKPGKPLTVESIVEIIIRPLLAELMSDQRKGLYFVKAMGRGLIEEKSFMKDVYNDILAELLERFQAALKMATGDCSETLTLFSTHFLSCSLAGAMMQHERLYELFSDNPANTSEAIDRLVCFVAGGINALSDFEAKQAV